MRSLLVAALILLVCPLAWSAEPTPPPTDDVADIHRLRAEQQSAWETLNRLNPFASAGPAAAAAVGAQATAGSATGSAAGSVEQLQRLLSSPFTQTILKQFSNPVFAKAVDQVIYSPHRMTLLYAQIGWVVFMLVFRAWRLAYSSHWAKRLWTRTWTWLVFWAGFFIAIPWIVLGEPYFKTLVGIVEVVTELARKS